jgi:hypothetical protein
VSDTDVYHPESSDEEEQQSFRPLPRKTVAQEPPGIGFRLTFSCPMIKIMLSKKLGTLGPFQSYGTL